MIHAHDLQRALLHGPHTVPDERNDTRLAFVPVLIEIDLPSGREVLPVKAVRAVRKGGAAYVLTVDGAGLVLALAERVAGQSEALGRVAEGKTLRMREGAGTLRPAKSKRK